MSSVLGVGKNRRRKVPSKGSRTYTYKADPKTGESRPLADILLEKKLGRKLKKGEQADHIDGNEKNNALSNLQVLTSYANEAKGGRNGAAVTNAKRGRNRKRSG